MPKSFVFNPFTSNLDTISTVSIDTPANGLSIDSEQLLSLGLSSASTIGALSSTDWSTFNGKQDAGLCLLLTGGTMQGPIDMGGFKITTLANGTVSGDAVNFGQLSLYIPLTQKGANNGVATLDSGGKVPVAQLPSSVFTFEGTWDASTNTPTLANGTGDAGMVYVTSVAGTVNFGAGAITFAVGDWAVYNGSIWQKSINSNAVSSVNGQTGVVVVNAINQLTGDATAGPASGSASAALTLATVNAGVGSFGSATAVPTITVNAKGLITAASSTSIQIAESQVTNLVSDLAGKQPTGNYITALTGDVVANGPGSVAATIQAGVITNSMVSASAAIAFSKLASLTSAHILVGSAGNVATDVAVSGDISLTNAGVTAYAGTVPLNKGGTGQTTKAAAFDALSPMTTVGDVIVGGTSGTGQRLPGGTDRQFFQANSGSQPSWANFLPPTIQKFTSGSGTYTKSSGVLYIRVRLVGPGGGGGGSGLASRTDGTNGSGPTTFGTSLLVGNTGGGGSATAGNIGGLGGTATLGTGPIGTAIQGSQGGGNTLSTTLEYDVGGSGGTSPWGGAGGGGSANIGGGAGIANSGSGGGGAGCANATSANTGCGGGSGGYVDAIITSPSATYAYAVGAGGTGGSGGTSGFAGGNGGSGYIEVTEYYQ